MTTSERSSLDTLYRLNPNVVTRVAGPDALYVLGVESPLTIPLAMLPVLSAFSEEQTVRDLYATLEADLSIEELGELVGGFVARGVITRAEPEPPAPSGGPCIGDVLNRAIFSDPATCERVGRWLREGRALVIPDALPADLAERVWGELDRSKSFAPIEGGHDFFHYRNNSIEEIAGHSEAVDEATALFCSAASRDYMSRLSGKDCSGTAVTRASWYRPGEYALPHDDSSKHVARAVAYIWYLAKDWPQEWGGGLFWCPTGQYVKPGFNVLTVFDVRPENVHMVCPVTLGATGKRLSLNGFYCEREKNGELPHISPEATVSPRAYGPREVDGGAAGLIVL